LLAFLEAPVHFRAERPRVADEGQAGGDRRLFVGWIEQVGARDEQRHRQDAGRDRQRVDPGIEHAEAARLPDPFLPRMPFAHILEPADVEQAYPRVAKQPCRLFDRLVVLGMPGREQCPARRASEAYEMLDLAERGRGRLFEQDVNPRIHGFAGDGMANIGRRADGERVDFAWKRLEHLLMASEMRHPDFGVGAAIDDGRQLKTRIGGDHRRMLVAGDLAKADDGDPDRHQSIASRASTKALAWAATWSGDWPGR
jgi:hypothetical protein